MTTLPPMAAMSADELHATALRYIEAGLSAIPADCKKKRPQGPWKQFQNRLPEPSELRVSRNSDALAIICGPVSGNLEVIDFDQKAAAFDQWAEKIGADILARLAISTTQSGGKHVYYRCIEPVTGNQKLAQSIDRTTGEVKVLIETRGQGGLVIASPTEGYEITQGDLCDLPTITVAERKTLLAAAREFNELPDTRTPAKTADHATGPNPAKMAASTDRPGDWFNTNGDMATLLTRHGWTYSRTSGDNKHWTRPDKGGDTSATFDGEHFYVFSSNAEPFEPRKAYTPFMVLALLEHGGDLSAAAKSICATRKRNLTSGNAKPGIIETVPPLRWRSYPIEILPEPVRQFVEVAAEAIQVDPAFVALPVIICAAAAIGNTRRVNIKTGWSEPCVLWGGLVAPSGATKSPALAKAVSPVEKRQESEFKRHGQIMSAHKTDLATWKAAPKGDRGTEPEKPEPAERFTAGDVTTEALADRLQVAPRGLLVYRDELSGWFASFGAYKSSGGGDMQSWLQLYNAAALMIDRKTGDQRTIYVERAAACVLGGIQPGALQAAMGNEHFDSGLAARLLLAWPPTKHKQWTSVEVTPEIAAGWSKAMARLYEMKFLTDPKTGKQRPSEVMPSMAAKELFEKYYNQHNTEITEIEDNAFRAAYAKLEGGAARLALVIHCLRWACGDIPEDQAFSMDATSMDAGIELAQWHKNETKRIYRRLYGDAEDADHQELSDWISERGGSTTAYDLHHTRRGSYPTTQAAKDALENMVSAGAGKWKGKRFCLFSQEITQQTT